MGRGGPSPDGSDGAMVMDNLAEEPQRTVNEAVNHVSESVEDSAGVGRGSIAGRRNNDGRRLSVAPRRLLKSPSPEKKAKIAKKVVVGRSLEVRVCEEDPETEGLRKESR